MNSKSGWFRDFTRFVVVLLVWEGMISTGYGQDQSAAAIPAAQVAAPVSRLTEASAARFATGKAALTSKTQPLAQVPDFRAVISVSASLSALTTASVTNNTLTITYSVFNLRGDPDQRGSAHHHLTIGRDISERGSHARPERAADRVQPGIASAASGRSRRR